MRKKNFKKKTSYFIETGSYIGEGIDLAIKSGFDFIYSIELSTYFFNQCKEKFKTNPDVEIIFGDSSFELPALLNRKKNIPFTYWLDGHYSGDGTARGSKDSPLIEELNTILKRDISGEIIYIDDMRIYKNFDQELNLNSIIEIARKYKPYSRISFEDTDYAKQDIMIIEY
jgi:hypothetical protein